MTTETHYLTIDGRDLEVTVSDNTFRAEDMATGERIVDCWGDCNPLARYWRRGEELTAGETEAVLGAAIRAELADKAALDADDAA